MSENEERVTIKDIADSLGLSTATISNVIHGKTKKISDATVAKVQEKLEESGYIPNMAAVLLARNSSRIVCVVLSDDSKYEGRMLEDYFVSAVINRLSKELKAADYFMMIREEKDISQIINYASMWNMAGLILIGYCEQDYDALRSKIHIPIVVLDACTPGIRRLCDIGLDNERGGALAAACLYKYGHRRIMYLADNKDGSDLDRYHGMKQYLLHKEVDVKDEDYMQVNIIKALRYEDYEKLYERYFAKGIVYTAVFCASDVYAIEFMQFLQQKGVDIPGDFSIVGFDDSPMAEIVSPKLTTIHQDFALRAKRAVVNLTAMIEGVQQSAIELLPLRIVERQSVGKIC